MASDLGFRFQTLSTGDVEILRGAKRVTILRGEKATDFLESVAETTFDEQQAAMARVTGNYRRGNERASKSHPRNAF